MDDFPVKIADLLETVATRIRAMTVDRVRGWAVWAAVGVVVGMLGLLLAIFLIIGLFRLLAELVGAEPAYLILGGLFVIVGMLLWSKRMPKAATGSAGSTTKE
jgi:hypothetical protein